MTKPVYLHTDNDVEILKTFDMVLSHMQAIADPYQWKWVITGWHSILQNAMVLALCQDNDFQVYLADGKASTRDIFQQIYNDDFSNIDKLLLQHRQAAVAVFHGVIPCDEGEQRIRTQRRLYGGDGQTSPAAQ